MAPLKIYAYFSSATSLQFTYLLTETDDHDQKNGHNHGEQSFFNIHLSTGYVDR
jgi:hypothetical protein